MAISRSCEQKKKRDKRGRVRARRVRVGAPDARLTPAAGVEAVRELDRVLGTTSAMDAGIGAVKVRRRGLTAGQLLTAVASCQMGEGDLLVSLDRRRGDVAGQLLEPDPTPGGNDGGRDRAAVHRSAAAWDRDGDQDHQHPDARPRGARPARGAADGRHDRWGTAHIGVYGRTKELAQYNHTGRRNLRTHVAHWAEAGVPLAAELMAGAADSRANSVALLDRAIAALPAGVV